MLNIIKNSFEITNKYIILATPLILFSLISSLYLVFSLRGTFMAVAIALVLFFLMLGAFLAGWFYMLKQSILFPDKEDTTPLIKEFPAGVGEYFLSVLGFLAIYFVIQLVFMLITQQIGMKFIGDIGISPEAISNSIKDPEALLGSLSAEQVSKINKWNVLMFLTMTSASFIMMFFPQALVFKDKNPLKAFAEGVKSLFSRKFFTNLGLFLLILASYVALSLLTVFFGTNIVVHFVFTLINFYYFVYVAVLLFNYYYKNFVKFDKTI